MNPQTVLVTGATGFLGGHLCRHLVNAGIDVVGTGRNVNAGLELQRHQIRFAPVDLGDRPSLERLCKGTDTVVHAAALASAWATPKAYRRANVEGTENLLDAARAGGVRRFVHISTPAVLSLLEDQFDLTEHHPLPPRFTSEYGRSKAEAEALVSSTTDLETVTIRPKAIYGPGDTALLPRLVAAAERRRLPLIGDGSTIVHLTHVDDVVQAIDLVISASKPSPLYHIAGPEPVELWRVVDELLKALRLNPLRGRLSTSRAMALGGGFEVLWKALHLRGEPTLTRYKVATLAFSQTLDTSLAREELGFQALVTPELGLRSVLETPSLEPAPPPTNNPSRPVRIDVVNTATVRPPAFAVGRGWVGRTTLPVLGARIEHPERGVVRFDVGYGTSLGPPSVVGAIYRFAVGPQPTETEPIADMVVLSHLDPDHGGGVTTSSAETVVMDGATWESLTRKRMAPWQAMTRRALPADLASRVQLVDTSDGPVDLFDDGSIFLVSLPGHAPGHIGLVATGLDGKEYLFCGDAVLGLDEVNGRTRPLVSRLISHDRRSDRTTRQWLTEARARGVEVIPSHCSDTAVRAGWR